MEWDYQYGIVIFAIVIAAFIDIKTRTIPNLITIPLVFFGLAASFIEQSFMGLLYSVAAVFLAFIIFIIPHSIGTLGAGDVKLMMGIGAWLGPSLVIWNSILVMIAGGTIAFISLMVKVHPFYPFNVIKGIFFAFIYRDIRGFLNNLKEQSVDSIPYGVAILIGTVATIWLF